MSVCSAGRPAVFIDKDGTLVEDVPFNVDPALVRFTRHAVEGLRTLDGAGYAIVVVTNQPGIATGRFSQADFNALESALTTMIRTEAGVALTGFHACPHAPAPNAALACACRKPAPGMLHEAARRHGIDLQRSWMVGDILDDIEAGRRAGCKTVLLDVGNETVWQLGPMREPLYQATDLADAARLIVQHDAVAAARDAVPIADADGGVGGPASPTPADRRQRSIAAMASTFDRTLRDAS